MNKMIVVPVLLVFALTGCVSRSLYTDTQAKLAAAQATVKAQAEQIEVLKAYAARSEFSHSAK